MKVGLNMKTHWMWIALCGAAAIGCNAETHDGNSVSKGPTKLGLPQEPADAAAGAIDAAVACLAGQPAPQPQDAGQPAVAPCNGGTLVRSNIGYTCDCAGTGKSGPFCDGTNDDDAGTVAESGHTLSFSSPYYASCAVMGDHTVRCWGRNDFGELGDGTRSNRNLPTQVLNLDHVEQVDIGLETTCAVLQDASLRCWGYNGTGLLHDDQNNDRTAPIEPKGITNVAQVSLGDSQACVRHTDDTLECWTGIDHYGLLAANGTQDVVDLDASFFTTTAWLRDGSIRNWGTQTLPAVPAQARIKRIVGGYYHVCVLVDDGHVYCSGDGGGDGQSGRPEGSDRHVQGITDAIDLAAGFEHTCALLSDHSVRCWGQNERGQLGDGTNDDSSLPVKVVGAEHVSNVQCGRDHSCARFDDGSISCWGSNQYGQLGDGSGNDSNTPVRVHGL